MRAFLRRYALVVLSLLALAVGCAAMVAPELMLSSSSDAGGASKGLPNTLSWRKQILRIVIVRDKNWTAGRQERAVQGFKEWRPLLAQSSVPRFVIQSDTKPSGDINVWFVPDRTLKGKSVGLTRWRHSKGAITGATVLLSYRRNPMDEPRQRSTAAHELGHALGITYHSRHPDELMFFSSIGKTVTEADAERLELSYRRTAQ